MLELLTPTKPSLYSKPASMPKKKGKSLLAMARSLSTKNPLRRILIAFVQIKSLRPVTKTKYDMAVAIDRSCRLKDKWCQEVKRVFGGKYDDIIEGARLIIKEVKTCKTCKPMTQPKPASVAPAMPGKPTIVAPLSPAKLPAQAVSVAFGPSIGIPASAVKPIQPLVAMKEEIKTDDTTQAEVTQESDAVIAPATTESTEPDEPEPTKSGIPTYVWIGAGIAALYLITRK